MEKFQKITRKFKVSASECIMTFIQETPAAIRIMSSALGGCVPSSDRFEKIEEAIEYYRQSAAMANGELIEIEEESNA